MEDHANLAARWLAGAGSIVALTGAGVSAESGIPTFRGEGGLWRTYRAEDLATPSAFARDPILVWEWYRYRQGICAAAAPNAAHAALARIEERAPGFTLITQNVDGLHRRAGSRNLVEVHGDIFRARCTVCGANRELTGAEEETIPACPGGHTMRPDIVWFGETLPENAIAKAHRASASADLFLVIGTSAIVYPAASFPLIAKDRGARLVEVNPEETPLTPLADLSFRGKAAEILPLLVDRAFSRPVEDS
ncbi:MAG: NAD-dependent deacylase [Candidatus Eisenbacteria bacterium]